MAMIYKLGPLRLETINQTLFRGSKPIALGQRAVALLQVLIARAGAPVSKEELLRTVWPGLTVEEGNLTVQIAALRRVLGQEADGERWIETLPRRGYRYVGPVVEQEERLDVTSASAAQSPTRAVSDKPSIAVLPFANLSDDPDQEYFADGVVEDIITSLSRIKWLLVIARNSSFTYKGQAVDVKRVGEELGVRYLLEGSVRKARSRVRITAQMVEAETGAHLWAERYDRPLDDIFALQDEITLSVVGALEPSLREAEIERVKRKRPDNLDAYDLVLRALPHVYASMPEEAVKAIPFLDKAVAIEAHYAVAHGYLAWCHEILFVRAGASDQSRKAAIEHAHTAIDFGRDDATALALGGFVIAMVEHDRITAFDILEQALTISPSSAFTLFLGGIALAYGGEADRAIDWAERGLQVSPFDRLNFCSYQALAIGHFQRRRYKEAADAGRRAVHSSPNFSVSHTLLAAPLAKLGRMDEAKAAAARVLELQPAYSASRFCTALALPAELAGPLMEAWREAGLPD